eukprot:scaffold1131_cov161-Amphora_coffeaeformis.AAC.8
MPITIRFFLAVQPIHSFDRLNSFFNLMVWVALKPSMISSVRAAGCPKIGAERRELMLRLRNCPQNSRRFDMASIGTIIRL